MEPIKFNFEQMQSLRRQTKRITHVITLKVSACELAIKKTKQNWPRIDYERKISISALRIYVKLYKNVASKYPYETPQK